MYKEYAFDEKLKIRCMMSAFEADYRSDFYFKGEYHDFWEMAYVISGTAGVSADERIYELTAGEAILHKPMEFHKLWSASNENLRVLVMSFSAEGEALSKLENFVGKLDYAQKESLGNIMRCLRKGIKQEFSVLGQMDYLTNWEERDLEKQMIKNYAEVLLLCIAERKIEAKKRSDERSADIFTHIVRIMDENIYGWISIDEIATRCNFSTSYVKKIFKKYADCGIHEYFIKMKIKKAVSLMDSGLNVRQTSEKLSFANENYFGVVFKRETGVSPGRYNRR